MSDNLVTTSDSSSSSSFSSECESDDCENGKDSIFSKLVENKKKFKKLRNPSGSKEKYRKLRSINVKKKRIVKKVKSVKMLKDKANGSKRRHLNLWQKKFCDFLDKNRITDLVNKVAGMLSKCKKKI